MNYLSGDYVKITKLESINDSKMNPGYWILGTIVYDMKIGSRFLVDRQVRNGVEIPGIFQTSYITKIEDGFFYTENSKYKIEHLDKIG